MTTPVLHLARSRASRVALAFRLLAIPARAPYFRHSLPILLNRRVRRIRYYRHRGSFGDRLPGPNSALRLR